VSRLESGLIIETKVKPDSRRDIKPQLGGASPTAGSICEMNVFGHSIFPKEGCIEETMGPSHSETALVNWRHIM
jgi:hypothetical protein